MFVFWNLFIGPCLSFGACYLVLIQALELMVILNPFAAFTMPLVTGCRS
jgi:hypothetical protein